MTPTGFPAVASADSSETPMITSVSAVAATTSSADVPTLTRRYGLTVVFVCTNVFRVQFIAWVITGKVK